MNYYKEIKHELINNEIYKRVKVLMSILKCTKMGMKKVLFNPLYLWDFQILKCL